MKPNTITLTDKQKIKKLKDALEDAHSHLRYIGYGDSWEREGWSKLDDKIIKALGL